MKSSAPAMSFEYQEGDGSKTEASDGFVAIDIGALSFLSANNDKDSTASPRVPVTLFPLFPASCLPLFSL